MENKYTYTGVLANAAAFTEEELSLMLFSSEEIKSLMLYRSRVLEEKQKRIEDRDMQDVERNIERIVDAMSSYKGKC